MKKIRQLFSVLLTMMLLSSLLVLPNYAAAASSEQNLKVKALYEMGLFQGYDASGSNFGLEDKMTREQGLIFLIRMLGEDAAAKAWTGAQAYTDVPSQNWAAPYIGYAKEKGYTVGIGNNKFGLGRTANMQEMTIFALRGLGYSDASGVKDFDWNTTLSFAKSKGVLESDQVVNPFNRGVAVDIIFGAVTSNMKNQNYTLLAKLMASGVVTQAQYDRAMAVFNSETTPPAANSELADGKYTMGLLGKYIRVTSGKVDLRDTAPAQVFTVINKTGYCYIQTSDNKYLSLPTDGNPTQGSQLVTSATPYPWVIKKQSSGTYTIYPYMDQTQMVNANEEKNSNGTKIIIWPGTGTPKNALFTMTINDGTKVAEVKLNQTTASIALGSTKQLTATFTPTTATDQSVTWFTSNADVATVSANGVVTGVKAGTATITVKTVDSGKTASCKITVTDSTKKITGSFTMLNNTGKNIAELYITDSAADAYDEEFLAAHQYNSWSNGKSITTSFEFYANTKFDIFVRFKDGSEAEALNLSFAKATSAGGKLNLSASDVKLVVGSDTVATASFTVQGGTDTTAASKAVITRFNTDITRWNALSDKCVAAGLEKDATFVKDFNDVTKAINDMQKEMGMQTTFPAAKITEYNNALNAVETLMNELDKALLAFSTASNTTATESKDLQTRLNRDIDRWNTLRDECTAIGLNTDTTFVKDFNAVADAISEVQKEMSAKTTFTAAQIVEYKQALTDLETLMAALDKALANITTDSKTLLNRLETDITRWNILSDQCTAVGLGNNTEFSKRFNAVSDTINAMRTEMGTKSLFTFSKITEYNTILTNLETYMSELDQVLATAKP